jgi:hypothetical protein
MFLKNLKMELPDDPAKLLIAIFSKGIKGSIHNRDNCTSIFITELLTTDKLWN